MWHSLTYNTILHITGEYDPAEIHNSGMIRRHMIQVMMNDDDDNDDDEVDDNVDDPGVRPPRLADGLLLHLSLLSAGLGHVRGRPHAARWRRDGPQQAGGHQVLHLPSAPRPPPIRRTQGLRLLESQNKNLSCKMQYK